MLRAQCVGRLLLYNKTFIHLLYLSFACIRQWKLSRIYLDGDLYIVDEVIREMEGLQKDIEY